MADNTPTLQIIDDFWRSPDEALFDQKVLAIVLGLSEKWFERRRWQGDGIKFLKLASRIKYRKSDVLEWLNKQNAVQSTSQMEVNHAIA